jgi:hypothetical protein
LIGARPVQNPFSSKNLQNKNYLRSRILDKSDEPLPLSTPCFLMLLLPVLFADLFL